MTRDPRVSSRWFFGPASDLLLGCGLVYVPFFVWQVFDGPGLREWLPLTLLPVVTLLLGSPHYGATLLRVYSRSEDRRRYAIFAVWATAALFALFVLGLHVLAVGSLLVTLYFTWSPWHYSGQNYGLAVLFLRRRGIAVKALTKRFLYGSFILSYVLILLMLHTAGPVVQAAPASLEGTAYSFLSLGIPRDVRAVVAPIVLAAYLACLAGAGWSLRRAAFRDLLPTAALVGLQLLWFGAPAAAAIWRAGWGIDPLNPAQRPYAFMWIAVGHFVQYLWITTYYAAASGGVAGRSNYLLKALVAGVALWTLPVLLFGPTLLGRLPYDLGLALLMASVVNLHHFILDGAIWKLRDGRVARALLRPVDAPAPGGDGATASTSRVWITHAAWAMGLLVLFLALFIRYEHWAGNRAAEVGDMARVQAAIRRTESFGRVTPSVHERVARLAIGRGDYLAARRELEIAREIYPTVPGWIIWAALHEATGDIGAAAQGYEEALQLDGDNVAALAGSAGMLLRLGQEELAFQRLERAEALSPNNRRVRILLQSHPRGTEAAGE